VEDSSETYDSKYFARYQRQAKTPIGRQLMERRVSFVEQHYLGTLVDVGIGSGAFVDLRNTTGRPTTGFDINPAGVEWLRTRGLLTDPWQGVRAVSMWDVLEHMPDFDDLLKVVSEWVFVSIPTFVDGEHVLRSKHYRKDEHVWYFTISGLVDTLGSLGFVLVDMSDMETRLGREDIMTFAFRRQA